MPRAIPVALANDLRQEVTTWTLVLRVVPTNSNTPEFGITALSRDVDYNDGAGVLTYHAKTGFTPADVQTRADMAVDNTQPQAILGVYPADGVTLEGVNAGAYDNAAYWLYLINYEEPAHGHVMVSHGKVGQVQTLDELTCLIELRSLEDILKQLSLVELTSITCRATFGDARCGMPLRWYPGQVAAVGSEADRVFSCVDVPGSDSLPPADRSSSSSSSSSNGPMMHLADVPLVVLNLPPDPPSSSSSSSSGSIYAVLVDVSGNTVTQPFHVDGVKVNGVDVAGSDWAVYAAGVLTVVPGSSEVTTLTWSGWVMVHPGNFFVPGVVHWLTGNNAGTENELEAYDADTATVTLSIPARVVVVPGDTFNIRRDCDHTWEMCGDYGNRLRFRGEPMIPRGDGVDLQSVTPRL